MIKKITTLALIITLLLGNFLPVFANADTEEVTPSGIPFSELERHIDTFVAEHLGVSTPGVAIVVVHNGEIIFSRGYGYADIEQGILIDPATTLFHYASIGKTFVWTAAMQLVEQGLLDLDVDINVYLSEEARQQFDFEMPFTMRDLMNHSAGFAEVYYNYMDIEPFDFEIIDMRESLLSNQPLQIFTPGTASAYSNWGTTLAAYIIENITSQNFVDFEMENIFSALNITNTLNEPHWTNNQSFLQARANGYARDGSGGFIQAPVPHFGGSYPGGSVLGTAEDLARFIIALTPPTAESGVLFNDANTLELLFSSSSLDPENRPMTHHGFLQYRGLVNAIGHGGDTPASSTNFGIVPEERFGWVVLTNASGEFDIRFGLTDLLIGTTMQQVQPLSSNLPSTTVVEGRYIPLRRAEGTMLGLANYLSMFQISAIDDNTITLSAEGVGYAAYMQVEPYVFQITSSSSPVFDAMFNELRFTMEDGRPVHVHIPNATDITPLPQGRTMPFLIAYVAIAAASALFFIIMPIVLFVRFLVRKIRGKETNNQTKFRFFSVALLVSGLIILANNVAAAMTGLANHEVFTSATLNPHIIANSIFAGLSAILLLVSIFFFRKEISEIRTKSKVFYGITVVLLALFIFTLYNWNFFTVL